MNKLLSFSLFTAALALIACSDDKKGGASGTCANYADALQAATLKCGGKQSGLPAAELATAANRLATICTNALNAPGNGISAAAVDACAARFRETCVADDAACEDLADARGSLADGAACGSDAQCSGGDCKKSSAGDTNCGTCGQLAAIGAACGSGMPSCVRGATCKTTSSGASGTCVAQPSNLAEGATCYDPKDPSTFGRCASGLTCKLGVGSTAVTCTKRGSTGATCTSSSDCTSDLGCIDKVCGARRDEGGACKHGDDCASGACPTATNKCATPTYGVAGAACNNEELRCLHGSCSPTGDTATGTCVDPLADGAACTKAGSSSSKGPYCDTYSTCEKGTCQLFDPATCK